MTISDEIAIIANKIANEGKTPSVALIKSQLNRAVPLPSIIAVLKTWQHDPKFIQAERQKVTKDTTKQVQPSSEISLLIAQAIAPLEKEINELKQQVKLLLENQPVHKKK